MQKANKTYKCNNLKVCSALGQQLAKRDVVSLQDACLSEELLKTARRRCRCCSRNQSCATRRKCRVDYLWELKRFLGSKGAPFGRTTSFHHRLAATDGILSRSFSHLLGGTFLRRLLADDCNLGRN